MDKTLYNKCREIVVQIRTERPLAYASFVYAANGYLNGFVKSTDKAVVVACLWDYLPDDPSFETVKQHYVMCLAVTATLEGLKRWASIEEAD